MQVREITEQDVDLPESLDLPLRTGAPYWYWLGGRPSLDLVNTLRERWRRQVETLCSVDDLGQWLVAAGLMEQVPARIPRRVLDEARDLREALDTLVVAAIDGTASPQDAVALVDDWLVFAGARPQLVLGEHGVPVLGERPAADSPRRALGVLAFDAARMLGQADARARIRICGAEDCSARFYDRSPGGRRRWCSMRTCGNVAKARRHRARARQETEG
ncbi:ABATE domain-containing protein [Paraconexibacter sp.]|uniref:CGNR zinc finger domain-containing protein n=1 Tax=Paraconexibacter sp. TaxID=2949640 RepID=UPI003567A78A